MKGKKKLGKQTLIKAVMANGVTARKAEKVVNAVFNSIKFALWCGEPVEIPGGTIQSRVRQGKERKESHHFQNVQTGEPMTRAVCFPGRRRVVKFKPDPELDLTWPPVPETAEEIEARQLASDLLGKPATKPIMAELQQAVDLRPHKPGALLRRLKHLRDSGWEFNDVSSLGNCLDFYWWI